MSAISKILYRGPSLTNASKAMILLHGRGGTAEDILSLADWLCTDDFYIVAPQATNNIWYPKNFMVAEALNQPYLSASIKAIKDLIDQTAEHIPTSQIYIAGFSQGACLSLEVSARFATKYGGIMAFTGGLIGSNLNTDEYKGNFDETKIFISNGDDDPHIPVLRSEQSKEVLEQMNARVTLKIYKGRPHTITDDEINFVKANIISSL